MILSNKQYEIKNLQLFVYDYKVLTQFSIVSLVSLEQDKVDIILGSAWLDTLGTQKEESHILGCYSEVKFKSCFD